MGLLIYSTGKCAPIHRNLPCICVTSVRPPLVKQLICKLQSSIIMQPYLVRRRNNRIFRPVTESIAGDQSHTADKPAVVTLCTFYTEHKACGLFSDGWTTTKKQFVAMAGVVQFYDWLKLCGGRIGNQGSHTSPDRDQHDLGRPTADTAMHWAITTLRQCRTEQSQPTIRYVQIQMPTLRAKTVSS